MHHTGSLSAALLTVVACQARAVDTYNAQTQQLSVPTVTIGLATYTNVVVGVTPADILVAPNASGYAPPGSVDTYNPLNNELSIPAVMLGGATYYNGVVTVGNLISIGHVTGADTYNAAEGEVLSPAVQVGGAI